MKEPLDNPHFVKNRFESDQNFENLLSQREIEFLIIFVKCLFKI